MLIKRSGVYKSTDDLKAIRQYYREQRIFGFLCRLGIHRPGNYIMRIKELREDFHWGVDEMPRECVCGRRWWWPKK